MIRGLKYNIRHILIELGRPTHNAYIQNFNGTFRDECLDENWLESLEQARQSIATWRTDYNESGRTAVAGVCRLQPSPLFIAS